MLNPRRLFDADWHGMGIHTSRRPDESIAVNLTFQAVFDPIRYSSDNTRGSPYLVTRGAFSEHLQIGH